MPSPRGSGRRGPPPGLLALTALVALLLGTPPPAGAAPSLQGRNPRLGLVHVDLMDLHAVRLPDRPPEDRETLPAEQVAERYRRAVESGVGWHRWSVYWDLVERAGTDTWGVTDGIVARDVAHGLATLAVLQGNQPSAVHLVGAPEKLGEPAFLRADGAPTDDPAEAAQPNPANRWARFVAAVVGRYRPGGELARLRGWAAGVGVRAWQIGNEPNLPGFWRGTPAEYARLLEVAALVIEWLDPGATVVHGGIADDGNAAAWYGQFLDALLARAAVSPLPARYGYYFDKVAWHWYRAPSYLATSPATARALLAARKLPERPLWVTELGVPVGSEAPGPCWDRASPGRVTTAEQAGFVWQGLAEALAAGAENVFFFQLYDDCGNGPTSYDAFGLVRNHTGNRCWTPPDQGCWNLDATPPGSPRPAFAALQTAARQLAGARPAGGVAAIGGAAGTRGVVFRRPDGARVTVAWAIRGGEQGAAVGAAGAAATAYTLDEAGQVVALPLGASGGRLGLRLPGVTNQNHLAGRPIMAGRPVILVEGGRAGGPIQVAPPAGAAPAGGEAGAAAARAPAPARPADRKPPSFAQLFTLPATSPPLVVLTVVAADEDGRLGAVELYGRRGIGSAGAPGEWQRLIPETAWPGSPRTGQLQLPFVGRAGERWSFAVRVRDVAGNWTALPTAAQASTRLVGSTPGR
jgi:hypothetical protein